MRWPRVWFSLICFVLCTGLGCPNPSPGAEGVLFREEFARPEGLLAGPWRVLEGTARVEGGRLHITSERQNPCVLLERDFAGDLSVCLRLLRAPECHWSGMVVKGVYWLTVNRQYSALLLDKRSERVPSGTPLEAVGQRLAQVPGYSKYLWDPHDFTLRLDCDGQVVRAYLDDRLFIEIEDPAMPLSGPVMLVGGWGTDVYVDDLVVRQFTPDLRPRKPPPPPTPTLPEFTARLDRQDAIYHDGEQPQLTLSWRAEETGPLHLRLTLLDFYERPVGEVETTVERTAGRTVRAKVPLQPPRRGIFKVSLMVQGTGGPPVPQGDLLSFSVLPRELGERPANEASPFGGHPHWEVPEFHYALARKIGMRWARDHDTIQYTWWVNVQPGGEGKGRVWRWYDEDLAILKRNRLHLLGEFLYVPDWASSAPPEADARTRRTSPPRDLKDFARYVYETVKHYREVIKYWEVWNEPHYSGFWRGTPEQYVQLLRLAYESAKRANPDCVIIGGGGIALNALDWVERAFEAGLLRYCDVISFHYGLGGLPLESDWERFRHALAQLRALMRRYGEEKPLWNTEAAVYGTSFLDPHRAGYAEPEAPYHFREAAYKLVRMYVANLANGVQKVFYYDVLWPRRRGFIEAARRNPVNTRMLELHGGLKPLGVAYATLADLLEGAQWLTRVDLAPNVHAYLFTHGAEHIAVYWGNYGRQWREAQLSVPARGRWTLIDVMNDRPPLTAGPSPAGTGERLVLPLSRAPFFVLATGVSEKGFVSAWQEARMEVSVPITHLSPGYLPQPSSNCPPNACKNCSTTSGFRPTILPKARSGFGSGSCHSHSTLSQKPGTASE